MRATDRAWRHAPWAFLLAISGLTIAFDPAHAPFWVSLALAGSIPPWFRAWKAADETALRGALIWAALAIALGLLAQVQAWMEAVESGRPWAGRVTYLMVLMILAGLVSVLGARNPGGGAWAILMALLVVVFLIPWLEAGTRLRRGQGMTELHLHSPWTLFYGLLVLAGVTNYIPTRFGPAACAIGAGLSLEYLGLTRADWSEPARTRVWLAVAWTLALGGRLAALSADRPAAGRNDLERLWLWFRDHWGVVWALRVQERFNRSAELSRWPARLSWFGVMPVEPSDGEPSSDLPAAAEATLRSLLRRFVAPERIDDLLAEGRAESCQSEEPGR